MADEPGTEFAGCALPPPGPSNKDLTIPIRPALRGPALAALTAASALAAVAALTAPASADAPLLGSQTLRSLDTKTIGSNPRSAVILDGVRYFLADDGDHGTELYRSTGAGPATLVKDIAPGGLGSDPAQLMSDGDRLYFKASDGSEGYELWASDGTAAGTQALTTLVESGETALSLLGATAGTAYFAASDGTHGRELWVTDGTPGGTAALADIAPGAPGSDPSSGTVAGARLFFVADDGTHGRELWVTDGTPGGTTLTADLRAGAPSTGIYSLTGIGDDVYFNGSLNTAAQAGEPYTSDGTPGGTGLVKDLETNDWYTSNSQDFVAFNGAVYFSAMTQAGGQELYKTDGTPGGTALVADVAPGGSSGAVADLQVAGGALYFTADGANGKELWTSDGTGPGTHEVADVKAGGDANPYFLTAAGSVLYFAADDGIHGVELWVTDGTGPGTHLVHDVRAGSGGSSVFQPVWDGALLWFQADDGEHGAQGWTTDGTPSGTTSQPLGTLGATAAGGSARAGDKLITAYGDDPTKLLVTDGTAGAGTGFPIAQTFRTVGDLVSLGGKVYFRGDDNVHGAELWVTDGTDAGTALVADLEAGAGDGVEQAPIVAGGKLYFTSRVAPGSQQVWSSNGTAGGTAVVTDPAKLDWASGVTAFGDGIVFEAEDDATGDYQAWFSDGTAAGTKRLTSVSGGTSPGAFGVLGDKAYFTGDGPTDPELYVTDGTAAGTHTIGAGLGSPSADGGFVPAGGKLYYIGDEAPFGRQLHVTDGTATGTHLVKAIGPGEYYQGPRDLTAVGGKLAFTAGGAAGVWITDGTEAGTTQLVARAATDARLRRVGSRVLFAGYDDDHGTELWATDGTAAGTALAADVVAGAGSSHPRVLGDLAGASIVLGDAPGVGTRLSRVDASPEPETPIGDPGPPATPPATTTPVTTVPAPAPAPAKPPVKADGRLRPATLTLAVAAATDRKPPFRYRVTGRIGVPKGVAKAKACKGTVTVTARRGDVPVARASATVAKDCTYAVTVTKATIKRLAIRGGKLMLTARFSGNTALLPARSKSATVRYGGR